MALVDCDQVLLLDLLGRVLSQSHNEPGQVADVDSWQPVLAIADDWQCGQLWVQRDPSAPEEFIKAVVSLTVSINQAAANDVDSELLVEFRRAHRQVFNVLRLLEPRERYAFAEVSISECTSAFLSVSPGRNGRDDDQGLVLEVLIGPWLTKDLDDLLGFFQVSAALKVDDEDVAH